MQKTKDVSVNHSKSLWNYTLSPGWTNDEVFILKLALQKFGIGRWKQIIQSECLPGKSVGQIYLQTQRIMGQQSLGNFMGLRIDIEKVFLDNMKVKNALRKSNCIINTGDNPNKEERQRKIHENQLKYGLSKEYVKQIKLPRKNESMFKHILMMDEIEKSKLTTIEKIHHLGELKKAIEFKIDLLGKRDLDEYKPTFKNKGVMAPPKIEYFKQEVIYPPICITLQKEADGTYTVV